MACIPLGYVTTVPRRLLSHRITHVRCTQDFGNSARPDFLSSFFCNQPLTPGYLWTTQILGYSVFFTSSNILNLTKTSNHPTLGAATPRVNPTRICQTSCVLFSSITHSPLHYWSNQSNKTIVIKIQQWNSLWINLSCLSLFSSASINYLRHITLRCRISRYFTVLDTFGIRIYDPGWLAS